MLDETHRFAVEDAIGILPDALRYQILVCNLSKQKRRVASGNFCCFCTLTGTFKKRSMAIFGRSYVCGILFACILPDGTSDKKPQRHLRVALIA